MKPAPSRLGAPGGSAGSARRAPFVIGPARPEDDRAIRRLLREQTVGERVRLSLEREPVASRSAGTEGDRHHTVVARAAADRSVAAVAARSVSRVWINREPALLGYLGLLRRDPTLAGRVRLLRDGFAALDATRRADELPYDLTSIVTDNAAARRFLERGVRGLPAYLPWCGYVTRLMRPHRWRGAPSGVRRADASDLPAIADCLSRNLRRYQFAPVYSAEDLRSPIRSRGLASGDFYVAEAGGRVIGCVALWDQRAFKQAVVRGYAPWLARARRAANLVRAATGLPSLPPVGAAVDLAYISHIAIDGDQPGVLVALLRAVLADAGARGLKAVALGLSEANPMLAAVRRAFPAHEYRSTLYVVHRPAAEPTVRALDGRPAHVEVATL